MSTVDRRFIITFDQPIKMNLSFKGADEKTKTRLNLVLGDSYVDNVFVVHNNPIDTKISNRYYQYLFELSVIF